LPESYKAEENDSEDIKEYARHNEKTYAGEVFKEEKLCYDEQMERYVQLREEIKREREEEKKDPKREKKRKIRQEEEELRMERRSIREKRKKEDEEWKEYREERKNFNEYYNKLGREEKGSLMMEKKQRDKEWKVRKEERRRLKEKRRKEDEEWREKRRVINQMKESLGMRRVLRALVTVLLVMDNCTRKIYGLPLFVSGRKVTAEEVVAALREVLPKGIRFLISDNGRQFDAEVFKALASQKRFIHVRITPYRPRTNGIAERGIRTIKEVLERHSWENHGELMPILNDAIRWYNDRPHQGIGGLSPNEYERRLVQCVT
jgi:transposase InsO family protein